MIRIGVRYGSMIGLSDACRRLPGVHICPMSPSETIEALDICIYLFSEDRAGLIQAVTEMSSTDQTKFFVCDQNYEEDIATLLVKAGCQGYSLYDAIGKLKTIVSTSSSGLYWVPRSVIEKVVEEITVDRDAFIGAS